MLHVTRHARRLAEQRVHVHVDRVIAEMTVGDNQPIVRRRHADHCERATLARAHGLELRQTARRNGQHVAFLRFVAPDLGRRHAGFLGFHVAQFETRPAATAVGQFRQGIGNTSGTDVMHGKDRIAIAGRGDIPYR